MDDIRFNQVRETLIRFQAKLPAHGRVLIIPHDYPDPDALASAMAMHLLLSKLFHVQGQIVFSGMVSRAENRELLRCCQYHWRLMENVRASRETFPCVFLDTAPWSGNVTVPPFGHPIAVIDHHPFTIRKRYADLFSDIRVETGATASILYEYLTVADIPVPKWLASVMAYAIASETLDLSRNCTELDLEAYTSLLARSNMTLIGRMRHAPLPQSYYAQLQEAIRNAYVYGRVAWTHLEAVQQPEIVPEVADLLCRMERVTWSFCTAYQGDSLIVSLRSDQKTARCGSLLKSLFRKQKGSFGGHNQMAAGFLDVTGLAKEEREECRESIVKGLVGRIEPRAAQDEPLGLVARPLVQPSHTL